LYFYKKYDFTGSLAAQWTFSSRVGYNPYIELDIEETRSESDDSDTGNPDIMSSGLHNVPADELFTIEKLWAKKVIKSTPPFI